MKSKVLFRFVLLVLVASPGIIALALSYAVLWKPKGEPPLKPPRELFGLPNEAEVFWYTNDKAYQWVKFRLDGECFIQRSHGCPSDSCTISEVSLTRAACSTEKL